VSESEEAKAVHIEDATQVRLGEPSHAAGGPKAVLKSLAPTVEEMGTARGFKTWLKINQTDGFDCPSCAWPDPEHRHRFEFCENGAKAVADEATTRHVDPDFFAAHSVAWLSEQSDHWLNKQGRLTHPMVLQEGASHYEPISWDDAFSLIAEELNALASPDEALFYTSGRTSNEAAFLYQLFVRQFGTNNLPDCSNMCHESSGAALTASMGFGKSTVTLDDLEQADCIFVVGQNPGTNHPRMLTSLQTAARHGAKIVSVNPLPEVALERFRHPQEVSGLVGPGTPLACLHLPVRVNGDVALFTGLMKAMLERGAVDREFIDRYTEGFDAFADSLRTADWAEIVENSGVSREEIERAAEIAATCERMVVCWAMGVTQHKNGVANVQTLVNFVLLRGMIGKPGAGLCCVRGHSNVQGDRTMGIWEKMPDSFLNALGREFGFDPPRRHGLDTVDGIRAMEDGRARIFFAMGGNFLSATPDTEVTARVLRRCRLTAHVATKLNRSHLITGRRALILPCLGRTERDMQAFGPQFVTCEDAMNVVHKSEGRLAPASEHLLSEPAIVARLARAVLGGRTTVDWEALAADYDRIRDHIARVVPGFADYNARVRRPGGFMLPTPPRERAFPTPSGRARFTAHAMPRHDMAPGQYLMMTLRSHDQFNTTVYGLDDRYRGVYNGRRVSNRPSIVSASS
jgi:molybdopterin-dependent oxidoreductase alpha subunit